MCPKEFIKIGAGLFFILGILGATHILGPTSAESLLGEIWWIDSTEAILFAALGLILLSGIRSTCEMQSIIIFWVDWFVTVLFVLSLFLEYLFTIHFESPAEPIFFLVFIIWGHLAGMCQNPK